MGVASTVNKWTYVLDGETLIFPYTTKIFAQTDLVVQIVGTTTTTLILTTDYDVSGAGNENGGNVTLVNAGNSGDKLVIRKVLPLTQTTDLVENDPNRADVMEDALDKMILIAQQIDENVQRAVVRDITQSEQITLPIPSGNKLIGWDSAGTGLENKTTLDADVQADCEAAKTAAETAQGLAEEARDAAIVAQGLAEEAQEAAELIADLEVASQADAEAGTNNSKMMTPLRTAQAITALQDDDIPHSYLDTDVDLAANSDVKVPSQKAVKSYIDNSPSLLKSELFIANGTFTVPADVTTVYVTMVGAGGGGGKSGNNGGGGAGGQCLINYPVTVTPGGSITVTVGVGGLGATYSPSTIVGGTGGNSSFGSLSVAGGPGANGLGGGAAVGGSSTITSMDATGQTGATPARFTAGNGRTVSAGSNGGGGGASLYGNGGNGGSSSTNGTTGSGYGGGGGGSGSGVYNAGNGSNGFVLVAW